MADQPTQRAEGTQVSQENFNKQFEDPNAGSGLGIMDFVSSAEKGGIVQGLHDVQEAAVKMVPGMDNVDARRLGFSAVETAQDGSMMFAATQADAIMRPKKGDTGEAAKDQAMDMFNLDGKYKMQHTRAVA